MLKVLRKEVERNEDGEGWENYTTTHYITQGTVRCDGSSIWSDTKGKVVTVDSITVMEHDADEDGDTMTQVYVRHDSEWDIYTDRGFEAAISDALGFNVMFTEQGMQDDGVASMELA